MAGLAGGECFGTPDPTPDVQFDRPDRATSGTLIGARTAGMGVDNATVRVVAGTDVYTAIVRSIAMKRGFATDRICGTFTTGDPAVGPEVRTDYQVGPFVGPAVAPTPETVDVVVSVIIVLYGAGARAQDYGRSIPPCVFDFIEVVGFTSLLLLHGFRSCRLPSGHYDWRS